MAKSRGDRPPTCTELVAQLRDSYGLTDPPQPRRGVVLALAVTAAVVLCLAIVAVTLLVRSGEPAAAAQPQGSLVAIDAQTGDVTGRVTVPGYPGSVIAGPWGVWTADFRTPALWRVAPGGTEAQRVGSPGEPRDLAGAGPYVYVASDGPQTWAGNVVRFFGATGQRVDAVPVLACAVGSGDGVVWAAGCPAVQRLSTGPAPLRVVHDVPLPYPTPLRAENDRIQFRELAVGGGSLWVLGDALDRRLWRLDALTGEVLDTLDLPFVPRSVAAAGGLVWVTDPLDDQVIRVDMTTGSGPAADRPRRRSRGNRRGRRHGLGGQFDGRIGHAHRRRLGGDHGRRRRRSAT